jgi:hypothetical protein
LAALSFSRRIIFIAAPKKHPRFDQRVTARCANAALSSFKTAAYNSTSG